MKYVGLMLYHAPTVADCLLWLTEEPHPSWDGPPEWGDPPIAHVSGPFKIVPTFFDGDTEQSWCVIAEHDTEAVSRRIPFPYGAMDNDQLLRDCGLQCAISAAIRQYIGVTDETLEDQCIAEIGRLYREEDRLCEVDEAEYGKG